MLHLHKKKKGFTLAEVLITLGIIGVVAAMTMTNLIVNYQKQETIEKLKKANSVIGQFLQKAENDNGCLCYWTFSDHNFVYNTYIKPYFNVINNSAKYGYSTSSYFSSIGYKTFSANGGRHVFKTMEANSYNYFSGESYADLFFMTTDGFLYGLGWNQSQLTGRRELEFLVDINGPRLPNVAGKDVFMFKIGGEYCQSKVWPYKLGNQSCSGSSCVYTPHKCGNGESCKKSGFNCACNIIENGWKMPADYPW